MKQQIDAAQTFGDKAAASYDDRFAAMAPMREALHLLTRAALAELPDDARILCVGAGTGLELAALAQAFPGWRFTLVEPAPAMLSLCRQRAQELQISERCEFHEGYLDTLPATDAFDGATCLLVSQFLVQREARVALFAEMASRLRPGGLLVSADLTSDVSGEDYPSLLAMWTTMLRMCGISEEDIEKMLAMWGSHVGILPAREVEAIIREGGFASSVLFLQTAFIHAWLSRRAA